MKILKSKKEKKLIIVVMVFVFLVGVISFSYLKNKGDDEVLISQLNYSDGYVNTENSNNLNNKNESTSESKGRR